jgi:hypothetical protein
LRVLAIFSGSVPILSIICPFLFEADVRTVQAVCYPASFFCGTRFKPYMRLQQSVVSGWRESTSVRIFDTGDGFFSNLIYIIMFSEPRHPA